MTARAVFYAVNGLGAGHLTRLVAIARWVRDLSTAAGAPIEVWFLTTSEATGVLLEHGMASFKLPSKNLVARARIKPHVHRALAKQWVWHTLGLLRPDVFVVDTFPRGAFGELLPALDLAKHAVLVQRPVKAEVAARPEYAAMLRHYDRVWVPERELPEGSVDHAEASGLVCLREREELFSRAEARRRLGLPADGEAVLLTLGGGGDVRARSMLPSLAQALRKDGREVVVFGGPLHAGERFHGTGVSFRTDELSRVLPAFDAAVSAAGYNSHAELMQAGIPTVFVPLDRMADDQRARAQAAHAAGAAYVVPFGDPDDAARAVDQAIADRRALAKAARAHFGQNGARVIGRGIAGLVVGKAALAKAEKALEGVRGDREIHARLIGLLGPGASLDEMPEALRVSFAEAAVRSLGPRASRAACGKRARELCDVLAGLGDWEGAERVVVAWAARGAFGVAGLRKRVREGATAFALAVEGVGKQGSIDEGQTHPGLKRVLQDLGGEPAETRPGLKPGAGSHSRERRSKPAARAGSRGKEGA